MFSTEYDRLRREAEALLATPRTPDAESAVDFDAAIAALGLSPEAFMGVAPHLLAAARAARTARFDGAVFAVVPLYVTSICAESCLYCNYRAANRAGVHRARLADEELAAECEHLAARGYRAIELVYASDPGIRVEDIARHVGIARAALDRVGGGIVGLNAEPLETEDYRTLAEAGVTFSVLWMETYDRERFRTLHPGRGRKTRFEYRLDSWERMLEGGIPAVGLGVLSGLADWRRDWAMLFQHQRHLRESRGATPLIIGTPRLKPAPGAVINDAPAPPTEAEMLGCLALQALANPDAVPFVSTREAWDFCLEESAGGGVLFTFDCSTTPGGYRAQCGGGQFRTHSFDVREFAPRAVASGLRPVFRWEVPASGRKWWAQ